jgi:glutaredoxin
MDNERTVTMGDRLEDKAVTSENRDENAGKAVKIFSLSTCSHCKAAKKMLADCTVKYDFVDVDLLEGKERAAILEDVRKFNPKCSFPTIIIGDTVVVGFKEREIKEALGLK